MSDIWAAAVRRIAAMNKPTVAFRNVARFTNLSAAFIEANSFTGLWVFHQILLHSS